ncbi:MAG: hypothetical protein J5713_00385, partial [Clostridia bacterium]|nr:hypothetical protein [Clostridia bacterium]
MARKISQPHIKRIFIIAAITVLLFVLLLAFAGCQKVDKHETYISTSLTYQCTYFPNEDKTLVQWQTVLKNDTIYKINEITILFNLYYNDEFLREGNPSYNIAVKQGVEKFISGQFYASGNVDKIQISSWSPSFENVWDTYKIWFVVTIVVAACAAVSIIIIIILQDLELEDIAEFCEDHVVWLLIFAVPYIPYII